MVRFVERTLAAYSVDGSVAMVPWFIYWVGSAAYLIIKVKENLLSDFLSLIENLF